MGDNDTTFDGEPLFDVQEPPPPTARGAALEMPYQEPEIDEGLAYRYVTAKPRRLRVAPSHGEITNTVVVDPWPSPRACVRLDNERFAFDSSFPHATMSRDLARLKELRPIGTDEEKIAIFGHADPTGTDEYNKTLSGRRAKAIYGLLIRSPEVWDELHQQPFEGDKWGIASLHACLRHLGHNTGADDQRATPAYTAAMKAFEKDHHLPHAMDRHTRLALFGAYMDSLMGLNPGDSAYKKEDFVGEGKERDLRGAFQGCGERNPAMIVSKAEDAELAKPENRERRNKVQAANRRVLVFLYRKGDVKDMARWECPSAKEGPRGCDRVAWSNVKERLAPGGKRREVRRGGKTFGCKFYDFSARISPCEALRGTLRIWLMDRHHKRMPRARYRVRTFNVIREGVASGDGLLVEENVPLGGTVYVEWGPEDTERASTPIDDARPAFYQMLADGLYPQFQGLLPPNYVFPYHKQADLTADDTQDRERADAIRLHNLSLEHSGTTEPRFAQKYGNASLADVHRFGWSTGAEGKESDAPAQAALAPLTRTASFDPEQEILDELEAAKPIRAITFTPVQKGVKILPGPREPDKEPSDTVLYGSCTTHLYKFSFPVDLPAPPVPPKKTKAPPPEKPFATVECPGFGAALARIAGKLYQAFVSDPHAKDTDTSRKAFATWTMIFETNVGFRANAGFHGTGSAIDVNPNANPYFPTRGGGQFGGERHGDVGKDAPDPANRGKTVFVPTPLGSALESAYGLHTAAEIRMRLHTENVWRPCVLAVDEACQAILGVDADLTDRKNGGTEPGRSVTERFAMASVAVMRFLRLAYKDPQNSKEPTRNGACGQMGTYKLVPLNELVEMAVRDVLLGYVTPASKLGKALADVTPLESDAERRDEAIVRARAQEALKKLRLKKLSDTVTAFDAMCTEVLEIQSRAARAHETLRRGTVVGNIQWFLDEAEARRSAGTVFPIVGAPGVFGAVANWRDPRLGFMNQRVELVEAFEAAASELDLRLRWGAVDFGIGDMGCGDGMHFDFGEHDPGSPDDEKLEAWSGLQRERALAKRAHWGRFRKRVEPWLKESPKAKASVGEARRGLATVTVSDLLLAATTECGRMDRCLQRMDLAIPLLISEETSEISEVNVATDKMSARPHREAVEHDADQAKAIGELVSFLVDAASSLQGAIGKAAKLKHEPEEPQEPVEPPERPQPPKPPREPPRNSPAHDDWKREFDEWKTWTDEHRARERRHAAWKTDHAKWEAAEKQWTAQHKAAVEALATASTKCVALEEALTVWESTS